MARRRGCPFDPPDELTEIRETRPIRQVLNWDGSRHWLITRYTDCRTVLGDSRFSSNFRLPGYPTTGPAQIASTWRSFINMDGPEHLEQRRVLMREFTRRRSEMLRPRVQQIVDNAIDELLAQGPPADLVSRFALPVSSLVICELLGVPFGDSGFFQDRSAAMLNKTLSREEINDAREQLRAFLRNLVTAKETAPGDDLMSRLVHERMHTGQMTSDQIADIGMLLLIAGHETTADMIGLGTAALLNHPDRLAELRDTDDPALIANAAEELLRYLTITQSGRRRVAVADVEVGGQLIRAGEGVIVANAAGNRDPAHFTNPDVLDLHQKARHHLAFGYGPHQCLGQSLARVELQVVYGTLYRRIPTMRLAIPAGEVRYQHEMLIYGVHELPITW
ncbi:cytochrome P450 [Amycolatopsis rhizosphaerae]|uniref:Cytochrome P450 n=2 Tax=Amycolatopsis rhizosphaerae TaxID=2053003 RepID=A0A558DJJ1_9PSEU|nr:cytochrome P450 [Amycolatopsis rhizosphaerae]